MEVGAVGGLLVNIQDPAVRITPDPSSKTQVSLNLIRLGLSERGHLVTPNLQENNINGQGSVRT